MTSRATREAAATERPRSTRELLAAGLTWGHLPGEGLRRSAHGWYTSSAVTDSTTQRIVEAAALLPPGGAVGGWAAAYLHGVDWLDGLDLFGRPLPVPLCVPAHVHRAPTALAHWVRVPPAELSIVRRYEVPVTPPARTITDSARWAGSEEEALVVLDAALAVGITEPALRAASAATSDRRGKAWLRGALELCSVGVESPWESRLRYCWIRQAMLPRLVVNPELVDRRGGWLGRPDALDPESATALEYDGAHHRDPAQHRADNVREERLESANLVVIRVAAEDLGPDRRPLIARLQDARRRGLWRNPSRDDWQIRHRVRSPAA